MSEIYVQLAITGIHIMWVTSLKLELNSLVECIIKGAWIDGRSSRYWDIKRYCLAEVQDIVFISIEIIVVWTLKGSWELYLTLTPQIFTLIVALQ